MDEATKLCCTCGVVRPLTDFNVRRAAADGLQSRCRSCSKQWYAANSAAHRANVRRNKKSLVERNRRRLAEYLIDHPCVDCGETDVRCLDLDHRDGTQKIDDVARLIGNALSWTRILAEIDKCDVRCANCHRRITIQRARWWRQEVHETQLNELTARTTARLDAVLPADPAAATGRRRAG